MRKSRFTEEQTVGALREHEAGTSAKELCLRLGIAVETLYNWKRKYGGMDVSDARRPVPPAAWRYSHLPLQSAP